MQYYFQNYQYIVLYNFIKESAKEKWAPRLDIKTNRKNKAMNWKLWKISILYAKTSKEGYYGHGKRCPENFLRKKKKKNFYFLLNAWHHRKFRKILLKRFCEILLFLHIWTQKWPIYPHFEHNINFTYVFLTIF